ncbi:MAG: hypothetical protein LHW58_07850 [Candidatus Cloacimonetes bacterium]|nr:hypothetical protein [Candidatus Cloacimonadota bacterium]
MASSSDKEKKSKEKTMRFKAFGQVKVERLIYCGPNLPGGKLTKYRVFKGGIPEYLNDVIAGYPEIKRLFVPVADLQKAETAISTKGTPQQLAYEAVQKNISKGGV